MSMIERSTFLVAAIAVAAGCGSSTGPGGAGGSATTTSKTGSATASSGAAGGSTSSGVTTSGPPADAAWALTTTQPDASACLIAANADAFGQVTASAQTAVVANGAASGDGGVATVTCSVQGTGPFDVQAAASNGAVGIEIGIPSLPATATAASPAAGTVSYKPSESADLYTGPCSFYFVTGTPESAAAGKVWVAFTCPGLTDSIKMSTCPLAESYAFFENCVGG